MLHTYYNSRLKTVTQLLVFFIIGFAVNIAFAQSENEVVRNLKADIKNGNVEAMLKLAKVYERGVHEKQDLKKALKYYQDAANNNHVPAYYELGRLYENGIGVEKNNLTALSFYQKAADKGNIEGLYHSGILHEEGKGTEKNLDTAIRIYLSCWKRGYEPANKKLKEIDLSNFEDKNNKLYVLYNSQEGDIDSQYKLAQMYSSGKGFKADPQKAFELYKDAAEKGHPKAQLALGKMYSKGQKNIQKDDRLAISYLLKASSQGEKEADTILKGFDVRTLGDPNTDEYKTYIAKQGDLEAEEQYRLYQKYFLGIGIPRDVDKAYTYCLKAAKSEYPPAIMTLARMYHTGIIVKPDPAQAFYWFRKAAFHKNDSARFVIGDMYAKGIGTKKDVSKAIKSYLLASNRGMDLATLRLSEYDILKYIDSNNMEYIKYEAKKGNTGAQLRLGKYYYNSGSVEAVEWLSKAAVQGVEAAQKLMGDINMYGKCSQPISYLEAHKWYTEAGSKNNLEAILNLSFLYSTGLVENHPNPILQTIYWSDKYLALAQKDTSVKVEPDVYKHLGDAYYKKNDYPKAIAFYDKYLPSYKEKSNKPLELLEAFESKSNAYFLLEKYDEVITETEVALDILEQYKELHSVKPEYEFFRGHLLLIQGKAVLKKGNEFKACDLFLRVKNLGVELEQDLIDICLKN